MHRSILTLCLLTGLVACSDPAPVFVINADAVDSTTGGADGSGEADVLDPDAEEVDVLEDTTSDVAGDVTEEVAEDTGGDTAPEDVEDTSPDVQPDVAEDTTPDVAPDVVEDTTPDVAPDVVEDTTPDVAPDVVEDTTPDVVEDTGPDVSPDVVEDTTPDVTPVEVCDNGVDDDGDSFADCEDTDCLDRSGCRVLTEVGMLSPCGTEAGQGAADSWLVSALADGAIVRFEPVDAASPVRFNVARWLPAGEPDAVPNADIDVVEALCTPGSPELCEYIALDAGIHELNVVAERGTCGAAASLGYRLIAQGAAAVVINRDDVLSDVGPAQCDDGDDNDGDGDVDCEDADCAEFCEGDDVLTDAGSFDACPGQADIWRVTFGSSGGSLSFDTVSDLTTFDPVAITFTAVDGVFTRLSAGDDDFDCEFPPPTYSCPSSDFAAGTHEVMVFAGLIDNQCASSSLAEYSVTAEGGTTLELVRDNVIFVVESEESCTDGIDNDANDFFDCGDPQCADDPACAEPGARSLEGVLAPCETVDTYIVAVGPGGSGLQVDTVSDATTFDPAMEAQLVPFSVLNSAVAVGDDEFDCTFPPPEFSCPSVTLPEGVYEVAVLEAGVGNNCADASSGEYELSGDNLTSIERALEDVLVGDLP